MPDLTPTQLRAMLEAATPGPWTWFLRPRRMRLHHAESESASLTVLETAGHTEDYDTDYPGASRPDRDLIAAAPDLARALLEAWEECVRLRQELAAARVDRHDDGQRDERARVVAYGRAIERSLRGPQWTLAQASAIGVLMDDIEAGVHTEEDPTAAC